MSQAIFEYSLAISLRNLRPLGHSHGYTFFQDAFENESILPKCPDIFDALFQLLVEVEIPNGETRDSALRHSGVDVKPKTRRHLRLGETRRPHVTIFGCPMMTIDQIR